MLVGQLEVGKRRTDGELFRGRRDSHVGRAGRPDIARDRLAFRHFEFERDAGARVQRREFRRGFRTKRHQHRGHIVRDRTVRNQEGARHGVDGDHNSIHGICLGHQGDAEDQHECSDASHISQGLVGLYANSIFTRCAAQGASSARLLSGLVCFEVFGRYVILWDLFRVYLGHVRVRGVFHTADQCGLEGLALLDEFFDALGACLGDVRKSLRIAGLAGGTRARAFFSGRNGTVRSHSFVGLFTHALS